MQENKLMTQAVLKQSIKVEELPIKKLITQGLSLSVRPVPSLKRQKARKPKISLPMARKGLN